jgi:hypothetical protein
LVRCSQGIEISEAGEIEKQVLLKPRDAKVKLSDRQSRENMMQGVRKLAVAFFFWRNSEEIPGFLSIPSRQGAIVSSRVNRSDFLI